MYLASSSGIDAVLPIAIQGMLTGPGVKLEVTDEEPGDDAEAREKCGLELSPAGDAGEG